METLDFAMVSKKMLRFIGVTKSSPKFSPGFRQQNQSWHSPIRKVPNSMYSRGFSTTINSKQCADVQKGCSTVMDTSDFFSSVSDLHQFGIRLNSLPVVTIVGPQSSGKTSLLEAICGKSLFPKGMGMSTMKPFYITTIRSQNTKIKIGDKEFSSEKEAQDEIDRANRNKIIKTIDIYLESPNVYNNHMTDLPGLIAVANKNDRELPKLIRKMSTEHLSNPNSIPVVVHAATADPATNSAIDMVNKLDREQDAFGIITKIDMIEKQKNEQLLNMLNGQIYPLGYGWCGLILRSDIDVESGMSVTDKMKDEEQYKLKNPHIRPFGTEEMKKRLSHIQFQKIRGLIPQLNSDIDREIAKCKTSESSLDLLSNSEDNNFIKGLEAMIHKLVYSSVDRCEFEEKLEKSFGKVIHEYIERTFKREGNEAYVPVLSKSTIDSSITSFHSRNHSNPSMYKNDSFKDLFCFGVLAPTTTDNNTVRKALENECMLACTLPLFDFVIDDPLGKKRLQWNNYLNSYFDTLLSKDNIQNLVHQITVDELIKYIHHNTNDDTSKAIAEYMIRKISDEAFQSYIKYTIGALINIEKRPLISLTEIARYLTQIYSEKFTFHGGFFENLTKNNQKLVVMVYSDPWNEAYLKAVADKIVENCYRNIAVNLLDPMIRRLLVRTVDMISKKNIEKDKAEVSEKINKLNELRKIITKYAEN